MGFNKVVGIYKKAASSEAQRQLFILLTIMITLTSSNRFKYIIRKRIPFGTVCIGQPID